MQSFGQLRLCGEEHHNVHKRSEPLGILAIERLAKEGLNVVAKHTLHSVDHTTTHHHVSKVILHKNGVNTVVVDDDAVGRG